MYPFREGEQECYELLVKLYRQWTRRFGRPRFCKFDACRCNVGQTFLDCLERDGTTSLDVPGEAHEQMGDVEAQGQHFEQMLVRVLQEANPKTYPEWVECVGSTVEARNMLMKRHGYSAYQMVFGRDPRKAKCYYQFSHSGRWHRRICTSHTHGCETSGFAKFGPQSCWDCPKQ